MNRLAHKRGPARSERDVPAAEFHAPSGGTACSSLTPSPAATEHHGRPARLAARHRNGEGALERDRSFHFRLLVRVVKSPGEPAAVAG